jgi:hypothetical protein
MLAMAKCVPLGWEEKRDGPVDQMSVQRSGLRIPTPGLQALNGSQWGYFSWWGWDDWMEGQRVRSITIRRRYGWRVDGDSPWVVVDRRGLLFFFLKKRGI